MELTQLIYEIVKYYLIFCIATSISTLYMCNKILKLSEAPLDLYGKIVYYGIMAGMSFVLAPIFFIVFIFYSNMYIEGAAKSVRKMFGKEEKSS